MKKLLSLLFKFLPYPVLYLDNGKVIKSRRFHRFKTIVGICLTDEIIYCPLPKDNSYWSNKDGFYGSRYYGTWEEANAFFADVEIPGYKVASASIDVLVKIMDSFRKLNPILKKFGCEPIHSDWYYWSATSSMDEEFAWDYCNDHTGNGKNESSKGTYRKNLKNHFLGVLIPE